MKKTLKSNTKNHSITSKYVTEKEMSEIDMDLYADILGNNFDEIDEKYGSFDYIRLGEKQNGYYGETKPIKIGQVIKVLESFKNKGCNYVELFYHTDHIGYEFYGLDIHRSTDEEIKNYKRFEELKRKGEIQQSIEKLENQLNMLKGQL